VKHGQNVSLVNFYTAEVGNPDCRKSQTGASPSRIDGSGRRRQRLIVSLLAICLIAAVAAFFWSQRNQNKVAATPSIPFPEKSVAVLPFADLSPAKDQEYFCDGISEELLNALAQIEGLRVVARTSSFSFKGKNADVKRNWAKVERHACA